MTAKSGALPSSRCQGCGVWYVPHTRRSRFHSGTCYERWYRAKPEARAKRRERYHERQADPAYANAQLVAKKQRYQADPEYRARAIARARARTAHLRKERETREAIPEYRAQQARLRQERYERRLAQKRAYRATPEYRAKRRAHDNARYAGDADFRESAKARQRSPEYRDRQRQRARTPAAKARDRVYKRRRYATNAEFRARRLAEESLRGGFQRAMGL